MTQKLYCYVDETGQDTKGAFFLVVVLITSKETVSDLEKQLEQIEQESGKRTLKWQKARPNRRQAYLERLLRLEELKEGIFYGAFTNTTDYTALTAKVLIQGIQAKSTPPYKATIFIDGLNDAERARVRRFLKEAQIPYRLIRGLRDENSSLIRLCDAIAGLLRDHEEGKPYTQSLVGQLRRKNVIRKLPE